MKCEYVCCILHGPYLVEIQCVDSGVAKQLTVNLSFFHMVCAHQRNLDQAVKCACTDGGGV